MTQNQKEKNRVNIPPLTSTARNTLILIVGIFIGQSGITPDAAISFIAIYWESLALIGTLLAFASRRTAEKFQTAIEHPTVRELLEKIKKTPAKK